MRLCVELLGLMRIKLSCNSLMLSLEDPLASQRISLEELLRRLEALYAEQHLKLVENGEIKKGVLVMRKEPVSGRTECIPDLRDQWIKECEVVILATVMAGG